MSKNYIDADYELALAEMRSADDSQWFDYTRRELDLPAFTGKRVKRPRIVNGRPMSGNLALYEAIIKTIPTLAREYEKLAALEHQRLERICDETA